MKVEIKHKSLGLTLLQVIFITLKLAEIGVVKDWSWWWVLAPTWIPIAIALIMVLIVLMLNVIWPK